MGDVGSSNALHSARPRITLDGQVRDALGGGLLSMLVQERLDGLYRCELTIGNWGSSQGSANSASYLYFDRQLIDFGKTIEVDCGDGDSGGRLFKGRITGLEAHFADSRPPELVVLAEDRLQDLRMTRRTRTFEQLTDADLFQRIASEHGLSADVQLEGPTWPVLAQLNLSDLAFLRERARALGAELWVDDSRLFVRLRTARDAGRVTLTYGQGLNELSVLGDLSHQRTSLSVGGWDVSAKEGIVHEASPGCMQSELSQGQGGSAVLQASFGNRKETLVHLAPGDQRAAQALAEARYRTLARRFVTGQALAQGDARLKVGAKVDIQGVGTLFNGEYTLTETNHLFDNAHGFRSRFAIERPFIGTS